MLFHQKNFHQLSLQPSISLSLQTNLHNDLDELRNQARAKGLEKEVDGPPLCPDP